MALNFSSRAIFPSQMSEDLLVSPIRLGDGGIVNEGITENACLCKGGVDYCTCCSEGSSCSCCQDSDVSDFLPADPFGMDISSTFTAITGWLEDLEMNNAGHVGDVGAGMDGGDHPFFAGLNLLWNNAMAMKFQPLHAFGLYPDFVGVQNQSEDLERSSVVGIAGCAIDFREANGASLFGGSLGLGSVYMGSYDCSDSRILPSSVGQDSRSTSGYPSIGSFGESVGCTKQDDAIFVSPAVNDDLPNYCCETRGNSCIEASSCFENSSGGYSAGNDGTHYALYLSLGYLGLRDLLSVERVCKSVHSAVRTENALWRSLHVHQPLNEKITDEVLLHLTGRAQGKLECLSLVECPRITDDGLKRVLERNPNLSKLSVPGCTRLSILGLLESLRTLKLSGTLQLKHVRIGGIYGVTEEQFDELKSLLGTEGEKRLGDNKPHFYRRGNLYLPCQDNRVIDIEMCPRCEKARLVYDCPDEACMVKDAVSQACRACTLCIARCIQCGRCISDTEYEETFCLELLCSNCSNEEFRKNPQIAGRNVCDGLDVEPQADGILHVVAEV
ncbi:hypothetical protein MLD38_040381 [Melastoma candidum]|uniref:Uncharacterized protein n=1 Tax=Melastoma candidum TaxID=119954 RepID=A0ACB9L568_9MYRT|nr:hypothetical protein MLD38_040381 [Melastoma candidum]